MLIQKNEELIEKLEDQVNNEIKSIVMKLDAEKLLIFLLMQQELMFSTLEHEKPQNKETLSESFSYTINIIKHYKKINPNKLQNYNISVYIEQQKETLKLLISLLLVKSKITDFKIYISKQGYILNLDDNVLTITHQIQNYIKYYKLGYLRNVIEDMFLSMMSLQNNDNNFIKVIQKAFEHKLPFFEIMDKDTSVERIRYKWSEPLFQILTDIGDHNSEYKMYSAYSQYFSNSDVEINNTCYKSTNIRWIDLLKFSIGISNAVIFMDNTLKENCQEDSIMFNNSILFPASDKSVFNLIKLIFNQINKDIPDKDIRSFINKFTTDLTKSKIEDRLDIQFKPIVKVHDNVNFFLFRTFGATNLVRAYLSTYQMGLDDQGNKFEEIVKNLFMKYFSDVRNGLKFVNQKGEKGEIDICILGDKNIYFIECKNRLHPISATSAISNYEYIIKASKEQLPKAVDYFNLDRNAFIKRYFNKNIEDISNYNIFQVVMLSNRNVSGLNIDEVAIRDVYSLERILEVGYSQKGYVSKNNDEKFEDTAEKIYFWENQTSFQEIDLINYLASNSIFFNSLEKIAIRQEREYGYKEYTLRDFVYAYTAYEER